MKERRRGLATGDLSLDLGRWAVFRATKEQASHNKSPVGKKWNKWAAWLSCLYHCSTPALLDDENGRAKSLHNRAHVHCR